MQLFMNARCRQILNLLLNQTDYLSMKDLAQAVGVSRRTLYYDIEKINFSLKQAYLPELTVVREKGILISHTDREDIREVLDEEPESQVYIFTPEERARCIICYIIYAEKPVYINDLMECFEVSRNTIFADMKEVTRRLNQYGIELEYQPKTGYYLVGDTVKIRAVFGMYFNEMNELFTGGMIRFFSMDQIRGYMEIFEKIQTELGMAYVEGVLLSLAALVPICYCHKNEVKIPELREEETQRTKEYAVIQKYFPDMIPEEQMYLTVHLLGSRVNIVPEEFFEMDTKDRVFDLTKALVSEFEKVACIQFENRQNLERALFIHLNTSYYRYQFGIQIGNVLGDDIMEKYPELFTITKITAKHLEEDFGVPLPDSEIAYLAMHFGSFLKVGGGDDERLRILIVCANGIATGNMIRREVQKILPFAEIVDVVSAANVVNAQDICDLIITTVKMNSVIPVITVHPILTEFDRRSILNHKMVAPKNIEMQRENLFRVVKKYVDPEKYDALKHDLTAYIQGGIQAVADVEEEGGLSGMLDVTRIQIVEESCSWKQSIRFAGKSLLDAGSIERSYEDAIINQLQYYGPYMFLTDEIVLAHAKPEDGVNCLDVSMAIFKEPVKYSDYMRARIVIMLAPEDQEKHLKVLQEILTVFGHSDAVRRLTSCDTPTAALQEISRLQSD